MFKTILNEMISGKSLSEQEAEAVMNEIMSGRVSASQVSSLITLLRFRGETVEEITGFVRAMRKHMTRVQYDDEMVIDTCGTGGDHSSTFNISTASAIVVSSLGVKVAKHGNRAVSSKSGSADVLEYLGIPIQTTEDEAKQSLLENSLSFLFAPLYHSAMKSVAEPRREIGFRTVFNLIGPMANPAGCKRQVIGVYSTEYAEKMALSLKSLGAEHVLLVTGRDGLDEGSITDVTDAVELKNGRISRYTLTPEQFGLPRANLGDLQVANVEDSAKRLVQSITGLGKPGVINIVALNSAFALYVAGKVASIKEGVAMALGAIHSGAASRHFESLRKEGKIVNAN